MNTNNKDYRKSSIISILDTSIGSDNLGDRIIMESVQNVLEKIFADSHFIYFPSHESLSIPSYKTLYRNKSDFVFLGGTNAGGSNNWRINLWDAFFVKNIVFMGVGWGSYNIKTNLYWKLLYDNLLSKQYLHSVRDSYTQKMLEKMGFKNVINTSCPTMWSLTEEHCSTIPEQKRDAVVVTFTSYSQDIKNDAELIKILSQKYKTIYFFPQNPKDYQYMYELGGNNVVYINPSIKSLDEILQKDVDYIGTRLHAGIRALQHKKRTLILGVDNRALEISKDTGLPVIKRDEFDAISSWIDSNYKMRIQIPMGNIKVWKEQFQ